MQKDTSECRCGVSLHGRLLATAGSISPDQMLQANLILIKFIFVGLQDVCVFKSEAYGTVLLLDGKTSTVIHERSFCRSLQVCATLNL